MELTRRVVSRVVGRYNQWVFLSTDGVPCRFPVDERVRELLDAVLPQEDRFLGIGSRGPNNLALNIRVEVPTKVMAAFTEALGNETVATEPTEER